jgi:hypothetical protein
MTPGSAIDGVLVQWGERLFYPANRLAKPAPTPRLETMLRRKAAVIRRRIEATATGRTPQVMVKVTGGDRGTAAICLCHAMVSRRSEVDRFDSLLLSVLSEPAPTSSPEHTQAAFRGYDLRVHHCQRLPIALG